MKVYDQRNVKINVPFISVFGMVAVLGLSVYPISSVQAEDNGFLESMEIISFKQEKMYSSEIEDVTELYERDKALKSVSDPLMIVRFNQKKVYYRIPLKRVVHRVAKTKSYAKYEIQSIIPSGDTPKRVSKGYAKNVSNVINVFGRLGVSADRISVNIVKSDSVKSQEVHISVK